jgi:hypothetical protein
MYAFELDSNGSENRDADEQKILDSLEVRNFSISWEINGIIFMIQRFLIHGL